MKVTEFYEKYWKVNGKPVPPLSKEDKAFWDAAETTGHPPFIRTFKRGWGWHYERNPLIEEHIKNTATHSE